MNERQDFYADLGLPRKASAEDIRRAYHKAARSLHPDVNVEIGATELFLQIQTAYEVLSDPEKRADYDKSLPPLEEEPPPVELSLLYSRPTLVQLNEPQLIYVLVEMAAPPGSKTRPSPPLNVCLVLDRSTSMQGERMDTVKMTALELLRQLRPQDVFSIVTFSDRAEVLIPAGRRPEIEEIEKKVQMLHTGGGTEIFRGLEAGFNEVRNKASQSYTNHLILLTDGRTYGDEAACLRIADQAAGLGIGITGLGIGEAWNDVFLDNLATRTGGSCQYVSRNSDIQEFLKKKIRGLGHVYAERINLDLKLKPGVRLNYAFRLSPDAHPLPNTTPLRLGVIPKDPGLSFLLEFRVDPFRGHPQSITLAEGNISLVIPTRSHPTYTVEAKLTRPVSETHLLQPTPTRLMDAISRLNLYRMQESAQQYLAEGDKENAHRNLQNLATHLFSHGEHELARAVLQEAENIEQNLGFSEAGKKRIKYGTRALLLPASIPETRVETQESR